jgi:hypothetical protein
MRLDALTLTTNEAQTIRGTYNEIESLDPVLIDDGRYFLPLAVLENPNLIEVQELLRSFPTKEITIVIESVEPLP